MIAVLPPDTIPPAIVLEGRGLFAGLERPLPAWYAELAHDAETCPTDSHNGASARRDVGYGSSGRRRGYGAVSTDYKERPSAEERKKHAWAGGDRPRSGIKRKQGEDLSMSYHSNHYTSESETVRSKKTVHAMKQPLPHVGKKQLAKLAKRAAAKTREAAS